MSGRKKTTKKPEKEEAVTQTPEESSPPVTQVVEVVDEGTPQTEPETDPSPVAEEDIQTDAPQDLPAGRQEIPQEEEKRKEMVDELFDDHPAVMPEIAIHKKSAVIPFVSWVLVVLSVAAVTGGGLYVLIQRPTLKLPVLFAKPTPTPTPAPTPTPVAAKREDVSIQVLNGGGTAGAAGKMKKFLEDKGYNVRDVGNTDEYTYTKTEILVKNGKEAYQSLLESDLKDTYSLGTASATLPADVTYDVQVIVGKE